MPQTYDDARYRRHPSAGLRFAVLERDRFSCLWCSARGPSITLHIDHVRPFSLGGKTEYMNLATSCERCNIGKSDRISHEAEQLLHGHIRARSAERLFELVSEIPAIRENYTETNRRLIAACLPDPFWGDGCDWREECYRRFVLRHDDASTGDA